MVRDLDRERPRKVLKTCRFLNIFQKKLSKHIGFLTFFVIAGRNRLLWDRGDQLLCARCGLGERPYFHHMPPDASRCLETLPDASRCFQNAYRRLHTPPDASRCLQMPPDASRRLQMPPEASRSLQMPPDARTMAHCDWPEKSARAFGSEALVGLYCIRSTKLVKPSMN